MTRNITNRNILFWLNGTGAGLLTAVVVQSWGAGALTLESMVIAGALLYVGALGGLLISKEQSNSDSVSDEGDIA